jgi:branched-chain amino acid transport system ATP-binding protein
MSDLLLQVAGLRAAYGPLPVLHGIDLAMKAGEVAAMVGANGAGKTTTLRCLSGLLRARSGSVHFAGERIDGEPPHRIVARGLAHVPEGRLLFPAMSVFENLTLGAFLKRPRERLAESLDHVISLFPVLGEKSKQAAGSLSGGQQQMVAIGRALMARPRLLLLDEPSLGLAPLVVREMFRTIERLTTEGLSILLVEQNVSEALALADRAWVLENGLVSLAGSGSELLRDPRVRHAYLGLGEEQVE